MQSFCVRNCFPADGENDIFQEPDWQVQGIDIQQMGRCDLTMDGNGRKFISVDKMEGYG